MTFSIPFVGGPLEGRKIALWSSDKVVYEGHVYWTEFNDFGFPLLYQYYGEVETISKDKLL